MLIHMNITCYSTHPNVVPKTEAYIFFTLSIIVIITSLFGNMLVCLAVYKFKKLRTKSNAILCSLAITDLMTPITRLLSMSLSMVLEKYVFGCFWCKLSSCLGMFLCSASILHLCLITFERYAIIKYPYKYARIITNNRLNVSLVLIYSVSFVMLVLPFSNTVDVVFNMLLQDCEVSLTEKPGLSILLALSYFCIPLSIMLFVYYKIYGEVKVQNKKIRHFSLNNENERKRRKFRKEYKAVKIVIVVVGLFFLLWIPYFVVNICKSYYPDTTPGWLQRLVVLLAYTNSCVNWIVYCVMNKQLRSAFAQILTHRIDVLRTLSWIKSSFNSDTSSMRSDRSTKRFKNNQYEHDKNFNELNAADRKPKKSKLLRSAAILRRDLNVVANDLSLVMPNDKSHEECSLDIYNTKL